MSELVLSLIAAGLCLSHVFLLVREAKRVTGHGPKFFCLAAAVVVLAVWSALLVPNFVPVHVSSHTPPCVLLLKQLQGAKATWAEEFKKKDSDIPSDSDLFGSDKYMREKPTCPSGGVYRLGTVATNVTCSLGGPEHSNP